MQKREKFSSRAMVSSLMTLLMVVMAWSVVALGEGLKESGEASNLPPPLPHAELMTLGEFSAVGNISLEDMLEKLKTQGLARRDASRALGGILRPADLVNRLQGQ